MSIAVQPETQQKPSQQGMSQSSQPYIQPGTIPKPFETIPGPVPPKGFIPTLRALMSFSGDVLARLMEWQHTYGDSTLIELGGGFKQVMLFHPDDIRQVMVVQASKFHKDSGYKDTKQGLARFLGNGLLISDGEFWKRQRKLAAPALHAVRIQNYAQTMVDYTDRMLGEWHDGMAFDAHVVMKKLTMEIVAKTMFNTDVSGEAERVHDALEALQDVAGGFSLLPPSIPTPRELAGRKAKRDLHAIIMKMVQERRVSGVDQGDLLSMLLMARDEDGSAMSDEQARDEALTMFLAGHETTANALSWTLWLLSEHPEVERKLHAEVDRVVGGRLPTLQDMKLLPYTEMVIKESMRMYPPAPIVGREALEDVVIGGYMMPKGMVIGLSIYNVHHDPRWFPEPEKFDPERFTPENEAAIPRSAYIPFAAGPRVCIGNTFAMMEAQLCLATIVSRYRLTLKHGHKVRTHARLTLNPKGGLPMVAHKR